MSSERDTELIKLYLSGMPRKEAMAKLGMTTGALSGRSERLGLYWSWSAQERRSNPVNKPKPNKGRVKKPSSSGALARYDDATPIPRNRVHELIANVAPAKLKGDQSSLADGPAFPSGKESGLTREELRALEQLYKDAAGE